jgi:predicted phosphodiesterase
VSIRHLHHPEFSLWQSAVDQTVASQSPAVARPTVDHPMVGGTAAVAAQMQTGEPPKESAAGDVAEYCASIWWEIAKARLQGDTAAEEAWKARLGPFTTCDPRYAEAVEQYVDFFKIKKGTVPYRVWKNLSDFIIDWQVPPNAKIAIVGDWGTGLPEAKALLEAIARKNPDVVIHIGDIYYSGTEFEVQNYFWDIWSSTFDLSKIRTFTLAGNHDMYSGGGPYYQLIDKLGQPASYFCLRNADWQFVALDTGLHDDDALDARPTYLEDTEVQWLNDKVATAHGRRTVLISHHQLFTAFESIGGQAVNTRLQAQVASILPQTTAWFWGHEHDQVIYKPWQGVLGRCIGHGAYPVGITEIPATPQFPEVPLESVTLAKGPSFYSHGYAFLELDGASMRVSYYQDSDPDNVAMFTETLGAGVSQ